MFDTGALLETPTELSTSNGDASVKRLTPSGNPAALNQFVEEVYAELRRLAHTHMQREQPGHTLQTTALVHEAYLRLADCKGLGLNNRRQFFSLASRMMRHILVDYARGAGAAKRGAGVRPVHLSDQQPAADFPSADILALHEALLQLEAHDLRLARALELHAFGGLTNLEIAETLGVSLRTANRALALARAWLQRFLAGDGCAETACCSSAA